MSRHVDAAAIRVQPSIGVPAMLDEDEAGPAQAPQEFLRTRHG